MGLQVENVTPSQYPPQTWKAERKQQEAVDLPSHALWPLKSNSIRFGEVLWWSSGNSKPQKVVLDEVQVLLLEIRKEEGKGKGRKEGTPSLKICNFKTGTQPWFSWGNYTKLICVFFKTLYSFNENVLAFESKCRQRIVDAEAFQQGSYNTKVVSSVLSIPTVWLNITQHPRIIFWRQQHICYWCSGWSS